MKRKVYGRYISAIFIWILLVTGMVRILSDQKGGAGGSKTDSELALENEEKNQTVSGGDTIRVLIMTDGYQSEIHSEVRVSSPYGLRISCGGESIE